MEEVIDCLSGSSIFNVLDIKNAFLHVPIEEKNKMSFVTKQGICEFNYARFGFCNFSAVFIRYIKTTFRYLINDDIIQIYMVDIIIYFVEEDTGVNYLWIALSVAAQNNLETNLKKCKFLQHKVEFLGIIIEGGKVRPSEEKLRTIKHFPDYTNISKIMIK